MAVELSVLGPFHMTCHGQQVDFTAASARALLAFLAIEAERSPARAYLASLLWPDRPESTAFVNLRQALARVRKGLPSDVAADIVRATGPSLQFGLNLATVDLHRLDHSLASCASHGHPDPHRCALCFARRQEAIELYRGDVLQGLQLDGSQPLEEWLRIQRERVSTRIVEALVVQAEYLRHAGDYRQMALAAARQVEIDPWRERGYRDLILARALQGDRAAALAQFQRCERLMAEELGIQPEAATLRLRDEILELTTDDLIRQYQEASGPVRLPGASEREASRSVYDRPLVGRDAEVRALVDLLRSGDTRLITLTGPGGVGKTRLAREVLIALANVSPVEIRSVSLESVVNHDHVVFALADALEIVGSGKDSLATQLTRSLGSRQIVLLVDNAERVLDAGPLLARLVNDCPGLVMLVTSRQALRVAGERVFVVDPLPVSSGDVSDEPGGAVALLIDSAERHGCSRSELERDPGMLRDICSRLEGLPLAIELAAAKLSVLTPAELLARLERQLPLLTDGPRSAPQRQRTMRAAIAWDHDLLNDDERRVFRHLAVFPAGFTLEMAESVCAHTLTPGGRSSEATVLDRIVALREASLVADAGRAAGFRRFRLLDVIREYAGELLTDADELDSAWIAHADALIGRFGGKYIAPYAPDDMERDAWLESEFQNLRAVLDSLESLGDTRRYGTLAGLVGWYWFVRGRLSEGQAALEQAIAHLDDLPAGLVANIRVVLAKIWLSVGQASTAIDLLDQVLAVADEAGDAFTAAQVMIARGVEATARSDRAAAVGWFEAAMARAGLIREEEIRVATESVIRALRGLAAREAGHLDLARELQSQAIRGHHQAGSLRGEMFAWVNMGDLHRDEGDVASALSSYGNALELAQRFDDHRVMGLAASSIGQVVAEKQGESETGNLIARSAWNHMQRFGLLSRVPLQHLDRPDPAAMIPGGSANPGDDGTGHLPLDEVVELALDFARRGTVDLQLVASDAAGSSR